MSSLFHTGMMDCPAKIAILNRISKNLDNIHNHVPYVYQLSASFRIFPVKFGFETGILYTYTVDKRLDCQVHLYWGEDGKSDHLFVESWIEPYRPNYPARLDQRPTLAWKNREYFSLSGVYDLSHNIIDRFIKHVHNAYPLLKPYMD